MTVWHMRITYWVRRATNRPSGCGILIPQQWLHDCLSMFFSASTHWYEYWKTGNHVLGKKCCI